MDYSSRQMALLTIIHRVTGILSMFGAGYVIYEFCSDKQKQKKSYFRLLLGMMLIEFSDGLAFFCGSWMVPAGTWWGAHAGNDVTCRIQGFQLQMSVGSGLYNAGLALYYLLLIRYDWTERQFEKRVELLVHIVSLGWSIGTATSGLFLDLYTSLGMICYIGRTPRTCQQSYVYGYTTCEQGDNATLYNLLFIRIVIWSCFLFTAACMVLVFLSIRRQETTMAQYSIDSGQTKINRQYSKRFAMQGFLYVVVFYLGHIFSTINMIQFQVTGQWIYPLLVFAGIFLPFEGFLNCMVYLRPRFLKYLQKQREKKRSTSPFGGDSDDGNGVDQSTNNNNKSAENNSVNASSSDDGLKTFESVTSREIRLEEEENITLGVH